MTMLRSLMLILLSRTCAAFLTLSALAPGPLLDRAVTEVCFRYTCYREGLGSPLRLGKDVELTPIPRKGQGLVALRELPKGTLIGRYDGIVMVRSHVLELSYSTRSAEFVTQMSFLRPPGGAGGG